LELALYKVGCIATSNHPILSKIQWSRSSRTDKGVHAARLVISAKLEIDLKWLESPDDRAPRIVELLNEQLPADIRVHSCIKVNQGFRSRQACNWREYEYILPTDILLDTNSYTDNDTKYLKNWAPLASNHNDAIVRLNSTLKRLEGSNSYHNFHKIKAKNLKSNKKIHMREWLDTNSHKQIQNTNDNNNNDDDDEDDEEEDDDDEESKETLETKKYITANTYDTSKFVMRRVFENWEIKDREIIGKTRGNIFSFEVIESLKIDDRDFIKIRIRGQSFLLHQIRLMIGAAVAIVRGTMPASVLDFALTVPIHVEFPMAPAEGLVLLDAGFGSNCNGKGFSLTPQGKADDDDVVFSTPEEIKTCEAFFNDNIYKQIYSDWFKNDNALMNYWLLYSEKFRVPEEVSNKWDVLYEETSKKLEIEEMDRQDKELRRIHREIERFTKLCNSDNDKSKPIPYRKFLPNSMTTELITRFRVYPRYLSNNFLVILILISIVPKLLMH
jgi:tRNA pseudouridine(38-40) synthase